MYSIFIHGRSGMTIWYRPLHPYNAGTEHVGFPPTRQALLAPSAKRRKGGGGRRGEGGRGGRGREGSRGEGGDKG